MIMNHELPSNLLKNTLQQHNLLVVLWHIVLKQIEQLNQVRFDTWIWLLNQHKHQFLRMFLKTIKNYVFKLTLRKLYPKNSQFLQVLQSPTEIFQANISLCQLIQYKKNVKFQVFKFIDDFHALHKIGQCLVVTSHTIIKFSQVQCWVKGKFLLLSTKVLDLVESIAEESLSKQKLIGLQIKLTYFVINFAKGFIVIALQVVKSIDGCFKFLQGLFLQRTQRFLHIFQYQFVLLYLRLILQLVVLQIDLTKLIENMGTFVTVPQVLICVFFNGQSEDLLASFQVLYFEVFTSQKYIVIRQYDSLWPIYQFQHFNFFLEVQYSLLNRLAALSLMMLIGSSLLLARLRPQWGL